MKTLISKPTTIEAQLEQPNSIPSSRFPKDGITIYKLILSGIITYQNWLAAVRKFDPTPDVRSLTGHNLRNTDFGEKVSMYAADLGGVDYSFGYKWSKRTDNHDLESVKLINLSVFVHYEFKYPEKD